MFAWQNRRMTDAMPPFRRFAVYAAPDPGPLAEFAARWLGWDPVTGTEPAPPDVTGLPRPQAEITADPRKYGFHGTLKPPFRPTGSQARLEADLAALAARLAPVTLDGLRLARLGRFLALVPEGDASALADLAAEVVAALDPHRAPQTEADLARRRAKGLSPRQEQNLQRWGYPYVMEEFRFHLTLTGPLPGDEADQVAEALRPHLAPLLPRPFVLGALCLFGEAEDGRFHLLHRYALTG
ncbi:putative phosphonate metabolism protein [Salipiger marinus]|uniref:Putative phosphonate metabolism protein n=2 Tax=Salipiger marinus TaxID=555512 RepID=A0A1G8P2N0_9RHOB|nr:putative phosphonate metabolism protein [Salipiger marinus]